MEIPNISHVLLAVLVVTIGVFFGMYGKTMVSYFWVGLKRVLYLVKMVILFPIAAWNWWFDNDVRKDNTICAGIIFSILGIVIVPVLLLVSKPYEVVKIYDDRKINEYIYSKIDIKIYPSILTSIFEDYKIETYICERSSHLELPSIASIFLDKNGNVVTSGKIKDAVELYCNKLKIERIFKQSESKPLKSSVSDTLLP